MLSEGETISESSNEGSSSSNNEVINESSNGGESSLLNSEYSENNDTSNKTNTPNHVHSWTPVTNTVWHDEVGHWESVVIKDAWVEEIPVYEERGFLMCNDCGANLSILSDNDFQSHLEFHVLSGGKGSWRSAWEQVQVGTDKINHPAVTENRWVVDKAAWSETVTTGYKCSCGANK